jgi:predicted nucleic acid binding AN1-type Zn finger protein
MHICFATCEVCGSPDVQDEPCDGCGFDFCAEHADHADNHGVVIESEEEEQGE